MSTTMTANEAIQSLQNDGMSLSASRRRKILDLLRDSLGDGFYDDSTIRAIYRLASDPDRGVRQEVASLVHLLPEEDFQRLFDELRNDRNGYVRDAAQDALKRREKERREAQQRRREVRWIQSHTDSLENQFGKRATRKILDVTTRRCSLTMGSVIHNINETMSLVGTQLYRAMNQIGGNQATLRLALEKMEKHLLFLSQHFNDMAVYSRPGRLSYRSEPLAGVVTEALEKATAGLREKGRDPSCVQIDVSVPAAITLEISRHRIVTALANIVKNAIEAHAESPTTFAPGRVSITAHVTGADVVIAVKDNGMGMHEEDLQEIRQFLLGRTTKKNHGTGFGLPIAEQFVAIHGGSVTIDSQAGQGTTVIIQLPQNQP